MLGNSLRVRLVLALSIVFVLGLVVSAAYNYVSLGQASRDIHNRTLQSQARELIDLIIPAPNDAVALRLDERLRGVYADPKSTFYYTLYDRARTAVEKSQNLGMLLPFAEAPPNARFGPLRIVTAGPDEVAGLSANAGRGYTLIVGRSEPDEDALTDSLLEEGYERFFVILLPFTSVSVVIIWLISHWSLRPVARASEEAALIGPENPTARILSQTLPSEIRPLVDAVNGAVDRLARAYTSELRFTADAAHELRTPLAVLNLRLQEAKLKQAVDWSVVEKDVVLLNRLVSQLLDLAQKESEANRQLYGEKQTVDVSRLMREAAAAVLPMSEDAGRSIEIDAPRPVAFLGRPDDLRDMMRNLLDNAVLHGEGTIVASVSRSNESEGGIVVDVNDAGAGPAEDVKEDLFARFRRGATEAPGSGLGLAIVRQVARDHGGEASFLPGSPCRVRVRLPG